MSEFEIALPSNQDTDIDFTNQGLYNYDFNSYSLAPLQKAAGLSLSDKIRKSVFSHISEAKLIEELSNKGEVEYVAKLSDYAKEKLKSGEWTLGIRKKTGETYAVIKDVSTGKNQSFVTLDKKVVQNLGNLPELSAIQGQLADIVEKIESLNRLVERVEQGQYNDRYAGFFSARQQVVEALSADDETVKKELLISAVKTNNDTIAKLMLAIHHDALTFIDTKIKPKEAQRIDNHLQNSIGYLNSTVQLNLVAHTALGEQQALIATLMNYKSFIGQTLLEEVGDTERTLAWQIDNAHKGMDGKFDEISLDVTDRITYLVDEVINKRIGEQDYERIETEKMHDAEL
ncbi:hypothetical protein QUF15_13020 [Lactococcus lactis]|uniref:hypothetical protein n=1 Tax=Lactococcus lactis TaxID=1358 RepID=UPI0025A13202|nr:hypothetical protein [Lactococcus lactis]MBU6001045.1 hypothetical protein [Lactococcus lactis]MDM7511174.1 hypothetical protein [Lactococcus lactis]